MRPKLKELPKPELKKLLQDVESSGFTRDEVAVSEICDNNEQFYGARGSERRRNFQRKFYQLRRNSLLNYSK